MQIKKGPIDPGLTVVPMHYEIHLPPVASRVLSCQDLNNQILMGTVRSEC